MITSTDYRNAFFILRLSCKMHSRLGHGRCDRELDCQRVAECLSVLQGSNCKLG